jgi:SWI/SNF-related matrix-associated actin-dependent regulator of chromatin subfamily A member 5
MPKEDRSDWVAVEPEFQQETSEIRKASTAFQFFQKEVSAAVKADIVRQFGAFDIAKHGRAVRDRWNALSDDEKERFVLLQREDQARFAQESHLADVAALERRQKLQQDRDMYMLDDEGGASRTTRHKWDKKQRKKAKKEQRIHAKIKRVDEKEFKEDAEDEESAGSWNADADSDSSSEQKKKKSQPSRNLTQKQIEHREKVKQAKMAKEAYIASRQQDLSKERAEQAKRRLEFLLKQSNIFSHFGGVKEDAAKFGSKAAAAASTESSATVPTGSSRRGGATDCDQDEMAALEEADEHEATFLTQQPTTLGFGQMREYQLEGLNWMIRLQENGVNGILADGTCC